MTPPSWLSNAAQNNVNFAQNLQTTGFTPYTGQQVAPFSPQQSASFGMGTDLANSVNGGPIGSAVTNYMNAGPQSVSPETISSQMSPYMNQYVSMALAPQIQAQDLQFAGQNKAIDAAATGSGAFGDTGWGQARGTATQAQDAARTGLIGGAYNTAFNTAIGAGAQDVSNNLQGQTTNANLAETALGRQLTGANAAAGLQTAATNLNNTLGGQQTAQQQAQLNAAYQQWLMAQQYPFQTTQLNDQAIAAGKAGAPVTTTTDGTQVTSAPDNSGFGILGSVAGSVLPEVIPFMGNGGAVSTGNTGGTGLPGFGGFYGDGGAISQTGDPVVVGERGPEVFIPQTSGVVVPNEVLEAARQMRGKKLSGDTTNIKFGIAA